MCAVLNHENSKRGVVRAHSVPLLCKAIFEPPATQRRTPRTSIHLSAPIQLSISACELANMTSSRRGPDSLQNSSSLLCAALNSLAGAPEAEELAHGLVLSYCRAFPQVDGPQDLSSLSRPGEGQ